MHRTLAALAPSLGLCCGLAAAQVSVSAEAAAIVGRPSLPGSGCDLLVATPGRLMAHLQGTQSFTLRSVCWLTIPRLSGVLPLFLNGTWAVVFWGVRLARAVHVSAEAAAVVGRPSLPGSGCGLLVATPGQLTVHVQGTQSFTLRSVCWLTHPHNHHLNTLPRITT